MAGTRPSAARRRSAQFARGYPAIESSQRPALGRTIAHDGSGRRSIGVSERNFFAELEPRNVYKVRAVFALLITPRFRNLEDFRLSQVRFPFVPLGRLLISLSQA